MNEENPSGVIKPETEDNVAVGLPYKVVLYNDDWHSFDDVIAQIIKAVKCGYEEARGFAFEAHVKGKTVVYSGELNSCLKVSSILEEISLHTQIIS